MPGLLCSSFGAHPPTARCLSDNPSLFPFVSFRDDRPVTAVSEDHPKIDGSLLCGARGPYERMRKGV